MARWVIGADEAGRGSLVGEMIVAVIAIPIDELYDLKSKGIKDSKKLSPTERAKFYDELSRMYPFATIPIRPEEIDRENLTLLTEYAIVEGISSIMKRLGDPSYIDRVTIDRYGKPIKLSIMLRRKGYRGRIIVEEKADDKYVEVSAASIIAKHVRDLRIRVLSKMYGVTGSGYPSDESTVDWVMKVIASGERPPIIRYSWGTLQGTEAHVEKKRRKPSITLDDFF